MNSLHSEYKKLLSTYGAQGWWPAESKFEVCVGAILTQNTAWSNVEKAIIQLKTRKLLTEKAISTCELSTLQAAVRSSGFYRQKAARLKEFSCYVVEKYGTIEKWFAKKENENVNKLRAELLALKGIGPETADSIILYAAGKAKFVIDAYTHRWVAGKFGWRNLTYDELQKRFETALPREVQLFKEFHALIVRQGKEKRTKTKKRNNKENRKNGKKN